MDLENAGGQLRPRLFIDMDGTLVDFGSLLPEIGMRSREGADEVPGLFANVHPQPGAVEAVKELSEAFDITFIASAPWRNPAAWRDRVEWIARSFGDSSANPLYKRVLLTSDKSVLGSGVLVDDGVGQNSRQFVGRHLVFGSVEHPNWLSIVQELRSIREGFMRDAAAPHETQSHANGAPGEKMIPESTVDALLLATRIEMLATNAHAGQTTEYGESLIQHLRRVASQFDPVIESIEHGSAWLSAIFNGTDITPIDLIDAGIAPEVLVAVRLLSEPKDSADTMTYFERIRRDERAMRVKLAELADKATAIRTANVDDGLRLRLENEYRQAFTLLGRPQEG